MNELKKTKRPLCSSSQMPNHSSMDDFRSQSRFTAGWCHLQKLVLREEFFEGSRLKGVRFVRKESCAHACMQNNKCIAEELHPFAIMDAHFFLQMETSNWFSVVEIFSTPQLNMSIPWDPVVQKGDLFIGAFSCVFSKNTAKTKSILA